MAWIVGDHRDKRPQPGQYSLLPVLLFPSCCSSSSSLQQCAADGGLQSRHTQPNISIHNNTAQHNDTHSRHKHKPDPPRLAQTPPP
ncbi:uncharacterized protein LY79DRAFT_298755 [Colletotrichum navitas]|uniref:Uncharacterized protein n=1 Tax=Colletotrichum navitas TaxID=681940 RepID=A0AAD8PTS2_9PEZI|nr:uncharacterized protein LY79DRAFT_298755 [Colletotrichum navitas]KAK1580606.1 hypothetical protein LY79DRAFT_298755 [Colletotrichum navitas]